MRAKKILFSKIKRLFIPDLQGWLSKHKSIDSIHCINELSDTNFIFISVEAEKACDKIQQFFMGRALKTLEMQGTYLIVIKEVNNTPVASIC